METTDPYHQLQFELDGYQPEVPLESLQAMGASVTRISREGGEDTLVVTLPDADEVVESTHAA